MTSTTQWVTQAEDPKKARQSLASALDDIKMSLVRIEKRLADQAAPESDPWVMPWSSDAVHMAVQDEAQRQELRTEQDDDSLTVVLPTPSAEVQTQRYELAIAMQLDEQLNPVQDGSLNEAYSKGGPMWLYLGGQEGRDYILSLPERMKRDMVADVCEHHTQREAEEFARDILKASTTEQQGAQAQISEEAILAQSSRGA